MNALEDHIAYWQRQCVAIGGTAEIGDGLRLRAPHGGFPTNGVWAFDGDAAAVRSELASWIRAGAPFSWTAADHDHDALLEAAGLHPFPELVLMERAVADLGEPRHAVHWLEEPASFVGVQMETHGIPAWAEGPLMKAWQAHIDEGSGHLAVVNVDDQVVGAGALHSGAGNAGMYAVGVRAAHRRQGIATSLLRARMRRALELGLTTAVATTTCDGNAFCQSHGFRETGRLRQWAWFPHEP